MKIKVKRYKVSTNALLIVHHLRFLLITLSVTGIFLALGNLLVNSNKSSSIYSKPVGNQSFPKENITVPTSQHSLPISSTLKTFKASENEDSNVSSYTSTLKISQYLKYKHLPSNLQESKKLQNIVDNVVHFAKNKDTNIDNLSISLIDIRSGTIAGYQPEKLRYPASVVKLFWLVALYNYLEAGTIPKAETFSFDLEKMMKKSDNEAASRILDLITNTKSGSKKSLDEYQSWLSKRYTINSLFQEAGYKDINISQKTFPIPSEEMYEPK